MSKGFKFDVFLSHCAEDKHIVRDIAGRLKSDGVRVWFDEWEITPGDSIPRKIEDGLEQSRALVLCLSGLAHASDWAQMESHTFRFKDPLNHDRRFIPLRLDDAPVKGSIAQFSCISWRPQDRDLEYPKLLAACQNREAWPGQPHSIAPTQIKEKRASKSLIWKVLVPQLTIVSPPKLRFLYLFVCLPSFPSMSRGVSPFRR